MARTLKWYDSTIPGDVAEKLRAVRAGGAAGKLAITGITPAGAKTGDTITIAVGGPGVAAVGNLYIGGAVIAHANVAGQSKITAVLPAGSAGSTAVQLFAADPTTVLASTPSSYTRAA